MKGYFQNVIFNLFILNWIKANALFAGLTTIFRLYNWCFVKCQNVCFVLKINFFEKQFKKKNVISI